MVSGWKKTRHDPWHKVYPSRVFNWMVSRLTGCRLHDHNCGFKLYRREVLQEVGIYGELHRFIPVLAHARGFRVGELEIRHRRRRHGASKYGFSRFFKGFLDLLTVRFLTRFGQRPLHVLGGVGLSLFGVGGLGMLYLALLWLDPQPPADRQSPAAVLLHCAVPRRRPDREPGNPGRAGHRVQHSRRGHLSASPRRIPARREPSSRHRDCRALGTAGLTSGSSSRILILALEKSKLVIGPGSGGDRPMNEVENRPARPEPRRFAALL